MSDCSNVWLFKWLIAISNEWLFKQRIVRKTEVLQIMICSLLSIMTFQSTFYNDIPVYFVQWHSSLLCTMTFQSTFYNVIPVYFLQWHSSLLSTMIFQSIIYNAMPVHILQWHASPVSTMPCQSTCYKVSAHTEAIKGLMLQAILWKQINNPLFGYSWCHSLKSIIHNDPSTSSRQSVPDNEAWFA